MICNKCGKETGDVFSGTCVGYNTKTDVFPQKTIIDGNVVTARLSGTIYSDFKLIEINLCKNCISEQTDTIQKLRKSTLKWAVRFLLAAVAFFIVGCILVGGLSLRSFTFLGYIAFASLLIGLGCFSAANSWKKNYNFYYSLFKLSEDNNTEKLSETLLKVARKLECNISNDRQCIVSFDELLQLFNKMKNNASVNFADISNVLDISELPL